MPELGRLTSEKSSVTGSKKILKKARAYQFDDAKPSQSKKSVWGNETAHSSACVCRDKLKAKSDHLEPAALFAMPGFVSWLAEVAIVPPYCCIGVIIY